MYLKKSKVFLLAVALLGLLCISGFAQNQTNFTNNSEVNSSNFTSYNSSNDTTVAFLKTLLSNHTQNISEQEVSGQNSTLPSSSETFLYFELTDNSSVLEVDSVIEKESSTFTRDSLLTHLEIGLKNNYFSDSQILRADLEISSEEKDAVEKRNDLQLKYEERLLGRLAELSNAEYNKTHKKLIVPNKLKSLEKRYSRESKLNISEREDEALKLSREKIKQLESRLINGKKHNLTVEFEDIIEKAEFKNLKLENASFEFGLTNKTRPVENAVKTFAIDPERLNFTKANITLEATGDRLLKCNDWDFIWGVCYGSWEVYVDNLVPGQNYTFEITPKDPGFIEINITSAAHLNSSYDFISDIYSDVYLLDDIWSEPIPSGHYIRAKFEKNLTNKNDIRFYARRGQEGDRVEVYEEGTSNILGSMEIVLPDYYRVLLTNLSAPMDTFDLKVVGASNTSSVEFDHIIDPVQSGLVSSCSAEFLDTKGTFPSACDATDGSNIEVDDDTNVETHDYDKNGAYAGLEIQSVDTGITNCQSVDIVEICYERWVEAANADDCDVSVDADGGASYTAVTTTCPGTTANPGVTCTDVTASETWTCANFFGAAGTRAQAKMENDRTQAGAAQQYTLTTDVFYFNVTWTAVQILSVENVQPAGASYNEGDSVLVSANVTTGATAIDDVFAEIEDPNGFKSNFTMVFNAVSELYEYAYNDAFLGGRYDISIFANDTDPAINDSETSFFTVNALGVDSGGSFDLALTPIKNTSFAITWVDRSRGALSFKVLNTTGEVITETVDIDTTLNVTLARPRLDVTPINKTDLIFAWVDDGEAGVPVKIASYKVGGTLVNGPTIIDTVSDQANGNYRNDISVTQLGDRFAVCYADDGVNDVEFEIWNNDFTLVTASQVDGGVGPNQWGDNLVDCAAINHTAFGFLWFDDGSDDKIEYEIRDHLGNLISANDRVWIPTPEAGQNSQVALASLDHDKFVTVAFVDDNTAVSAYTNDIVFQIRNDDDTTVVKNTSVDLNAGGRPRVAVAEIQNKRSDDFVITWNDQNSNDIRASVYSGDGTAISTDTIISNEQNDFRIVDVINTDYGSGNNLCNGTFVVAYTNSTNYTSFNSYYSNGTIWDGMICPKPKIYHTFQGNVSGNVKLGRGSDILFDFLNSSNGNVYATDTDSSFSFADLEPLSRTTTGALATDDFEDIDAAIGFNKPPRDINTTFSTDGTNPISTKSFNVYGDTLTNVPIADSTNSTKYQTGILWDSADSINTEFDTTDQEDLVFVTEINNDKQGKFGQVDYELIVPGRLQKYKGATDSITFYLELK